MAASGSSYKEMHMQILHTYRDIKYWSLFIERYDLACSSVGVYYLGKLLSSKGEVLRPYENIWTTTQLNTSWVLDTQSKAILG